MRVRNWVVLTLGAAGAVGVGASFAEVTPRQTAAGAPSQNEQVAGLLAARSPGERGAAAVSIKEPAFEQAAWTPTYASPAALGERTPAVPKVNAVASSPVAQPAVPATAIAPAVLAPTPVPSTAIAPLAAATPVAVAPVVAAAGGSSIGAAALLPAVPLLLAAGGGGGGGGSVSVAPAVPEPSTWMMMISGFAMLGFALRRRRRQLLVSQEGAGEGARFAGQHC